MGGGLIMKLKKSCSKCQSDKIIPRVTIKDTGEYARGELSVDVYKDPDALLFKGTYTGTLRAWICADCGFVELYLDNPQELYNVYKESQNKL